jgi:O-methyltransferase involved in polyketide biosynthesis
VADFDVSKPSTARVYDYWLKGKDNFAADREVGDRLMKIAPELPVMVRENKELLTRAVDWSARQGIRQFIDLGCGLPTKPGTHQTAQLVAPEAMTAYVDNDPVVISHLAVLRAKDPMVTVIDNDVDDSATVLAAAGERIDLSRPACLLLGALVHFYQPDAARELITKYVPALAPGSHVVLTAGYMPPGPDAERFVTVYSAGPRPLYVHSAEDLLSFLDGLEVLAPGVADARVWRPGCAAVPAPERRAIWMNGVMARVPARND